MKHSSRKKTQQCEADNPEMAKARARMKTPWEVLDSFKPLRTTQISPADVRSNSVPRHHNSRYCLPPRNPLPHLRANQLRRPK
jgi:hypothetical protein